MDGYASKVAITQANAIGLSLSLADWREIFLAITDTMVDEKAAIVTAAYVGNVRDGGERWAIKIPSRSFDVIYDPFAARVVLVLRATREPDRHPAIVPKINPPLKGRATLVDA